MEYAYVLVTPKGCEKGINIKILKDLINDGKELGLTGLICVYDLTYSDIEKLYNYTKNDDLYNYLKRNTANKLIMPLFIKGVNAINKIKQIVYKYNEFSNPELNKSERYLDNAYVSNDNNEAISDFCEYVNVDDFTEIEDLLFPELNCEINNFNFKALSQDTKNKKLMRN